MSGGLAASPSQRRRAIVVRSSSCVRVVPQSTFLAYCIFFLFFKFLMENADTDLVTERQSRPKHKGKVESCVFDGIVRNFVSGMLTALFCAA